jgi:hypothetical protein
VPDRKIIKGACLSWNTVLAFLDTLAPWQELCRQVESRCGSLTENTRRLMAVSVGVCSHNYDFPENLHRLMRMVEDGVAQPFRWHGHVSPARWQSINTVIVAIQGWLEEKSVISLSRTWGLKQEWLRRYLELIGPEPSHIKRAMLRRLLWNLIDNAVHGTGLGMIGNCDEVDAKELTYLDFTQAYGWDDKRYYFEMRPEDQAIRKLDDEILSFGQSGAAFLSYVKMPMAPFCQQKILRYQQVALHRIGGKWRDPNARPPGGVPRSEYEMLFDTYADAVSRWNEELRMPAADGKLKVYEKVLKLLGKRTECKRAVVDCLVFRSKPASDLQEAAYQWLKDHSHKARK